MSLSPIQPGLWPGDSRRLLRPATPAWGSPYHLCPEQIEAGAGAKLPDCFEHCVTRQTTRGHGVPGTVAAECQSASHAYEKERMRATQVGEAFHRRCPGQIRRIGKAPCLQKLDALIQVVGWNQEVQVGIGRCDPLHRQRGQMQPVLPYGCFSRRGSVDARESLALTGQRAQRGGKFNPRITLNPVSTWLGKIEKTATGCGALLLSCLPQIPVKLALADRRFTLPAG